MQGVPYRWYIAGCCFIVYVMSGMLVKRDLLDAEIFSALYQNVSGAVDAD